ncbi:glycoside hydrolase [Mycobacterium sp. 852013-51886_SCH5428379]|nr:glycoside hydrolase [Mycobacterium sp. 852013-51886_SCH5428379]MCK0173117.1 glycoside hydrolase [Mycolicibacterium sp. F2034L]OBB61094.1 glycoside hydrolase [Mycobacterium sp. 852013-51886_SCH5428379]
MGKGLFAGGRGRLLAVVASVALSGALLYAQSGTPADNHAVAAVPAQSAAPAAAPPVVSPPAALLAANAPDLPAAALPFELPAGVAPEGGLQVRTIWAARAISAMYPEITTIGGYRQDPLKWHPNGLAIDVMIPDHHSEKGIELGNQIAGLALANAERWGVLHVIWRQGYYPGVGAPSWTADYGSETLNHFDHVHIATIGGGYPTGEETYMVGSMSPEPKR